MLKTDRSVRFRYLAAFGLAVIVLWTAIALALNALQREAADRANMAGRNLARSLAENVAASVRAIDLALLDLREEWVDNDARFAVRVAQQQENLKRESIIHIGVIGADGMAAWDSLPGWQGVDLSDRPHFKAHGERSADELHIGAPILGLVSKKWAIPFTRSVYDQRKRFAGVIGLTVPPPALQHVYDDIELGERGIIALARSDGQMLAHSRSLDEAAKFSFADLQALRPESPAQGHFRRQARVDGVDRLYAYHRVGAYPLTVIVGQAADTVFAPYYAQRTTYLVTGALTTALLLAVGLLLFSRRIDRERVEGTRAQLAAIVEGSDDAVISLNRDALIVSWNAGAERLYGYAAAEAVGKSISMTVPRDRLDEFLARMRRVLKREQIAPFETVRLAKDGHRFNVQIWMSFIKDKDDRIIGTSAIARDITERKQVEAAFRQSEENYRRLFSLAREGIWVIDADSITTMVNPSMANMLGYAPEEMLGRHIFSFMDEDAKSKAEQLIERRRSGIKEQHDFEFTRKDGTRVLTTMETAPVLNEDGVYVGAIAGVMDITERKRMERALQREEERLRLLFDAFPIAVAYVDRNERVTFANRIYRDNYGDPSGSSPPSLREFVGEQVYAEIVRYARRALAGETIQFERPFVSEDGVTRTRSLRYVPDRDAGGEVAGYFAMREDVTERRRAEGQIRRLNQDLERRARERTAELNATVEALQTEVEERRVAEAAALTLAERIKDMTRRLGQAQEEERRRLAAELHDGVCSNLAAIGLNLVHLKKQLPSLDAAAMERRLSDLVAMIDEAKDNAKDISVDLRPLLHEDRDLLAALEDYGQKFGHSTGIAVEVKGASCDRRLPAAEKIALFRITQEALTNCAKHAQARAIAIELNTGTDQSVLSISDDGVGFDSAGVSAHKSGLGLLSMQERAEAIGGIWQIESAPGAGTRVTVSVAAAAP